MLALVAWLPAALAQAPDFVLPTGGCPMAHCDARMSNRVLEQVPAVASTVRIHPNTAGATGGLGCAGNGRVAVCTGSSSLPSTRPNLSAYDADGNKLWDDGGLLGETAWFSAAIVSTDDHLIAADAERLLRVDLRTGNLVWQSLKPDIGAPISPVLIGTASDMILLATKSDAGEGVPELSVWDLRTGALLWNEPLRDPATNVLYQTINTPAVAGARAYVAAAGVRNSNDGRLVALDVCESEACGGRGRLVIAWAHAYEGPASASPLLIGKRIFFDGLRARGTGMYYGVEDQGASAVRLWTRSFSRRFGANAAHDPRGGLWIYPWQSGQLLRLNERSGNTVQTVALDPLLPALGAGYSPVTAVSVLSTTSGAPTLVFGAQTPTAAGGRGPHVVAVDVGSTAGGSLLWSYQVAASAQTNAATGQFPVLVNAAGARRIIFRGTQTATLLVGEP